MRTTVNVKEGEQLYTTYTYVLSGTRARRDLLNEGKFFECSCERCSDPTELGTHFSSILCRKCKGGIIVPNQPLGMPGIFVYIERNLVCFTIFSSRLLYNFLQIKHPIGNVRNVTLSRQALPSIRSPQLSSLKSLHYKNSKHRSKTSNCARMSCPITAKSCIQIISCWST